jgi:hypothetical protein
MLQAPFRDCSPVRFGTVPCSYPQIVPQIRLPLSLHVML